MTDLSTWALSRSCDPVTSQIAAEEVQLKLGRLHGFFMESMQQLGRATANEVARHAASVSGEREESIRKRAKELVRGGRIVEDGVKVCRVTGKLATAYIKQEKQDAGSIKEAGREDRHFG